MCFLNLHKHDAIFVLWQTYTSTILFLYFGKPTQARYYFCTLANIHSFISGIGSLNVTDSMCGMCFLGDDKHAAFECARTTNCGKYGNHMCYQSCELTNALFLRVSPTWGKQFATFEAGNSENSLEIPLNLKFGGLSTLVSKFRENSLEIPLIWNLGGCPP